MQRNWEKWERYRDSKLEKMRQHKNNIERRMQSEKVEDWSYWSQRRDSLKRYPKHESLNPTWYTDNIYSNQSLDLDLDGGGGGAAAHTITSLNIRRHYVDPSGGQQPAAGLRDQFDEEDEEAEEEEEEADDDLELELADRHRHMDDDLGGGIFGLNSRRKHATGNLVDHHHQLHDHHHHHHPRHQYSKYAKYPKSRSCCFGGGYESAQQPVSSALLPKSSSFGAPREMAPRFECCSRIGGGPVAARLRSAAAAGAGQLGDGGDDVVLERLTYRRSVAAAADFERRQLENDMCYARQRDEASRHSMYMLDETYPPRRRPKHGDLGGLDIDLGGGGVRNKSDYIRNEWLTARGGVADRGGMGAAGGAADDAMNGNEATAVDAFGWAGLERQNYLRQQRRQQQHLQPQMVRQRGRHRQASAYDGEVDTAYGAAGHRIFGDLVDMDPPSADDEQLAIDFETEAAGVDREYFAYMRRPAHLPARRAHPVAASKSALEVQAPSRFDDSSSDSTDVDLDDFNFDFEKYWENLDKTNSSYDIDIQNNNTYNNLGRGRKLKDVNVARYNNGRVMRRLMLQQGDSGAGAAQVELVATAAAAAAAKSGDRSPPFLPPKAARFLGKHSHLLENLLAPSLDSSDNQDYQENLVAYNHGNAAAASGRNNNNINISHNSSNNNNNAPDNGLGYLSDTDYLQVAAAAAASGLHSPHPPLLQPMPSSPFYHQPFAHKIHPMDETAQRFLAPRLPSYPPPPPPPPPQPPHPPILKHPRQRCSSGSSSARTGCHSHNPFSLINNIFSIYKPKKYSALNLDAAGIGAGGSRTIPPPCARGGTTAKKMNVASTIRPLGGPANDFITSLKRPLLVTPPTVAAATAMHCTGSQLTGDQPHFKIIPEKTGLKITPLYSFDYDSGERKYMLRSTARPLMMFPN